MNQDKKSGPRLGLALSGGGYRAAAFHLGTLRALNNLHDSTNIKVLDKTDVMSTVSGGSIVGADYALSLPAQYPDFEKIFILKLKKSVIGRVLTSFTFVRIVITVLIWLGLIVYFQCSEYPWASWIVLVVGPALFIMRQFKIFPVSDIIEGIYDRIFFNQKKLPDLPDRPLMAINSTNIEMDGSPFTFSKNRMSDSKYEFPDVGPPILFKTKGFPVSRAVMASSCVPFAFTPVRISRAFFQNKADAKRVHPSLVDGGVYDNQGIHKLTFKGSDYCCDIVIVSDAGNKMDIKSSYANVITLLIRTMDIFMSRIKKFQIMDNIYQPEVSRKRELAYISLGWDLDRCIPGFVENLRKHNIKEEVIAAHKIPPQDLNPFNAGKIQAYLEQQTDYAAIKKRQQTPQELAVARDVGTNLTPLSDQQINALINQAELMTELQVKLYCPSLLM